MIYCSGVVVFSKKNLDCSSQRLTQLTLSHFDTSFYQRRTAYQRMLLNLGFNPFNKIQLVEFMLNQLLTFILCPNLGSTSCIVTPLAM